MLFNSFDFILFFTCVLALQWLLPHRPRNLFLLMASYFFYACWDWRFLVLIAISTIVDYFCGAAIERTTNISRQKRLVALSMVSNLGILGFFKYVNFFVDSAHNLLAVVGVNSASWRLEIVLPVGISFYTFQTMSYTIDIYRGETRPARSFTDFALFVSFFPQLVAGPIERAKNLLPQMTRKPLVTGTMMRVGLWLVLWGFFKKLVIADNMAPIVDQAFDNYQSLSGVEVIVALYAFAFQIYADFSGYTDIARGIASMMGYQLMLNFRLPYFATNPPEFWRRWHVSLSTWLRDYLYIPLGGNRKGPLRAYINLILTMALGGLWHGAAWNYLIWGAYHGGLLVLHRLSLPLLHRLMPGSMVLQRAWWLVRLVSFFHLICLGWLVFRAQSVDQILTMFGALWQWPVISEQAVRWGWQVLLLCSPLMLMQVLQGLSGDTNVVLRLSGPVRALAYATIIVMLLGLGAVGGREFIYFQF